MAVRAVGALVLFIAFFAVNEASVALQAPSRTQPARTAWHSSWDALLHVGSSEHLQALMRNGSNIAAALEQLPAEQPEGFREFLRSRLLSPPSTSSDQLGARVFLQARSLRASANAAKAATAATAGSRRAAAAVGAAVAAAGGSKVMSLDAARAVLNNMTVACQAKLDAEKATCAALCEKQFQMVQDARSDFSDYSAQGIDASEHVMAARNIISDAQDKLPRLGELLKLHRTKCSEDDKAARAQMARVRKDAATLQSVLQMSKCKAKGSAASASTAAASAALLQCRHSGGGGRVSVAFQHPALERKVSELQTSAVRTRLRRTLAELAAPAREARHLQRRLQRGHPLSAYQRHMLLERRRLRRRRLRLARVRDEYDEEEEEIPGRRPRRVHRRLEGLQGAPRSRLALRAERQELRLRRQRELKGEADASELDVDPAATTAAPSATTAPPLRRLTEQKWERARRRCVVRSEPTCDMMRDKFLNLQASVEDKEDGMKEDLAKAQALCKQTEQSYQAQIGELSNRLALAQTKLAAATERQIQAQEASRLKEQQVTGLDAEAKRLRQGCEDSFRSIANEMCGVKQIRQELYAMEKEKPFIQDCEVSDWTPEECSKTCGGGTQVLRRTVVAAPQLGARCPPLAMTVTCADHPCPVDCRLEDWSEWSACSSSAPCVPGVKERIRQVRVAASHRGTPCQPTTESVRCNLQACDADCKLSAWTAWTGCSKACGGGFHSRERAVLAAPVGEGSCPDEESEYRKQYMRCNNTQCVPTAGEFLQCDSKVDVLVLLDGSGSIGEPGWTATKRAASNLVKAFKTGDSGARVGALLFSGPGSAEALQKCTNPTGGADMAKDCNLQWVSHYSTDTASIASGIEGLKWPKGSTMTSSALASAETELLTSRRDAQSVIIVLFDGRTMDRRKTARMARKLQRRARLIWVPVTRAAPLKAIKQWASKPVADNVLAVEGYGKLAAASTINEIIANACPKVL
eukprot:TRINITY_DN19515_c0_g1_i1.p1 TRINITY_DN19515_c0_g1~~TRINITY_DN19515_c0_g1_i1.p1  ORF type:complete len:1038 (-),score=256.60 TRINITY_DN19515_c0_g1_i1:27-2966(-)